MRGGEPVVIKLERISVGCTMPFGMDNKGVGWYVSHGIASAANVECCQGLRMVRALMSCDGAGIFHN